MKKRDKERNNEGMVLPVLKGCGIAYLITCVVFAVFAFILTYTDVSDSYIPIVAVICTAFSCFLGGTVSANSGSKGLLRGVVTGVVYACILIAVNILAGSETEGITGKITMFVCAMASGGAGGIIGVNKKQRKC